jgi:hypothetical protein
MPAAVASPPPAAAQPAPSRLRDDAGKAQARGRLVTFVPARTGTITGAAPSPGGLHPRMAVEEPRRIPQTTRRNVDVAPSRDFARPDRGLVRAPSPIATTTSRDVPGRLRGRPIFAGGAAYGVPGYYEEEGAPAYSDAVGEPDAVYDDGVVAAYPDPSWKLCQINERGQVVRYYRCGPYSYRPYGAYGYRPYGSYRAYPTTPAYVAIPNAKIISIEPRD